MLLFAVQLFAATEYNIVDLGTLTADESSVYAINGNGKIIGSYLLNNERFFFEWDETNGLSVFDLPSSAVPKVLNDNGQIAGEYLTSGGVCGFFWDPQAGFTDLGSLGGQNTWVAGMNSLGQIVGASETGNLSNIRDNTNEIHAFIWQEEIMKDLGVLNKNSQRGDESRATGINDQGEIVGCSNYALMHKGKWFVSPMKPFIYVDNEMKELLSDLEVGRNYFVSNINNDGDVILLSYMDPSCYLSAQQSSVMFNKGTSVFKDIGGFWHSIRILDDASVFLPYIQFGSVSYGTKNNVVSMSGINVVDVGDWISLQLVDYNNNWFIAHARNVYGETHGVVLMPNK